MQEKVAAAQSRIDQRRGIARRGRQTVSSGGDRAASSEIGVGTVAASCDALLLIDEVTTSAVHRSTGKRSGQRTAGGCGEFHRWVTDGEDRVGIAARIGDEKLSKSRFEKESLADRDFGRISVFLHLRGRFPRVDSNRRGRALFWR